MNLPRGITGFRDINDPPLPVTDYADFRGACYEAARTLAGRVRSTAPAYDSSVANYARADVELPDAPISILLNAHFPVIAFARPHSQNGSPLTFVDFPELASLLRSSGAYEVWSAADLSSPVTPECCQRLATAELDQVKYWKPGTVGEVAFNCWD